MQDLCFDLVSVILKKEIEGIYGARSVRLVDFWNETQVREPESVEEIEDVFFWEVLE